MIIASFPKGSFPENSWPVGTWLAAPAGADIQYTEVMEFAVCIATSAGFSVVLPNDASVGMVSTDIVVSGAGSSVVNGTYEYQEVIYGKPYYYKAANDMLLMWLPAPVNCWSMGYYISYDDVATPDLCTTWELGVPGVLPLPTVITPTFTEVAIFTLEMPTVIEIEVYEELSL